MKQNERDKILFNIDNNIKYSNQDLFFADLTPYYNFKDSDNSNFFEKILEYNNEYDKMSHNNTISFTPEQKKIFDIICSNTKKRYAISATTSFGKTTIIKEYIKTKQPNTIVYIVPTNSLADELLESFEKIYSRDGYEIIDTSTREIKKGSKLIFIGTQEKLKDIHWLEKRKIDLFVIDEAYKLTDEIEGFREVILNRVFIDFMNKTNLYLLLLPLVNNIKGLEKWDFEILQTEYSPVAKDFIGIDSELFDDEIVKNIKGNDSHNKNLVYFSSPKSLEQFFQQKLEKNEEIINDEWITRVESDFHSDWFPVKAYKMGIAIHYGPMPKFFQIRMVSLFNKDNQFNNILSTSSLIEGVNTPTKNIFIKDDSIFEQENRIKYKNLIGRAGRLGVTPVGNIFYNNDSQLKFEEANQDWKNLNIRIVLDAESTIETINRDKKLTAIKKFSKQHKIKKKHILDLLEKTNISIGELEILIDNLLKYKEYCLANFYPSSVPSLLDFYNKCYYKNKKKINNYNINKKSKADILSILKLENSSKDEQDKALDKIQYAFLRALLSATINSKIYGKPLNSISSMMGYIKEKIEIDLYNTNNSEIVSNIIGMMYSELPYDIIPFIELVIMLEDVFKLNKKSIIDDKIYNYLNDILKKYNLRYFGKVDCSDKERKIIKKMFEYGIPYEVVKKYIEYLIENIPDSFSINHIKSVIQDNEEMRNEFNKYFY